MILNLSQTVFLGLIIVGGLALIMPWSGRRILEKLFPNDIQDSYGSAINRHEPIYGSVTIKISQGYQTLVEDKSTGVLSYLWGNTRTTKTVVRPTATIEGSIKDVEDVIAEIIKNQPGLTLNIEPEKKKDQLFQRDTSLKNYAILDFNPMSIFKL